MTPPPSDPPPDEQPGEPSDEPPAAKGRHAAGSDSDRDAIALFPLSTILTPGMPLALHIFEERYRILMAELLEGRQAGSPDSPSFGVVALRRGWEVGSVQDVYPVGTTALLRDVVAHPDGRYDVDAIGQRRFVIHELDTTSRPYLVAGISYLPEATGSATAELLDSVRGRLTEHLRVLAALGAQVEDSEFGDLGTPGPAGTPEEVAEQGRELSYAVARYPALALMDRQELLACPDTAVRLRCARRTLGRELELLRQLRAIPAPPAMFTSRGLL